MTLAGDHQRVALFQFRDHRADRQLPVADLARTRRTGKHGLANSRGIFRAGIVVGDDDIIGLARGYLAHDRAFLGVAVAAAAEDHLEASGRVRAHGAQQHVQPVRRVGIVHEDPCPGRRLADQFEPSLDRLQVSQAISDLLE